MHHMKNCPYCGKELTHDEMFCYYCEQDLSDKESYKNKPKKKKPFLEKLREFFTGPKKRH